MFWRILRQMVRAGRARLALALVAVAGGAAVCTALLNIHFDAERKLAHEFAALGPNVVLSPKRGADVDGEAPLAEQSALEVISRNAGLDEAGVLPFLYFVGRVGGRAVMVAGTSLAAATQNLPWLKLAAGAVASPGRGSCLVGAKVAEQFRSTAAGAERQKLVQKVNDEFKIQDARFKRAPLDSDRGLELTYGDRKLLCGKVATFAGGGPEDSQILIALADAQELTGRAGKISLAQLRVSGAPHVVEAAVQRLSRALPQMDVRPIRQIAEAEGQILARIRGLIFATVAVILALTALCVWSATTALAVAHRRDVALMRALGGEKSRVLRLFLSEVAAIGVTGGALGWAAGIALSAWVGRQVFDAAIAPRLDVLPLMVALMTAVALAGAFPLRLLSRVRPAEILRGE